MAARPTPPAPKTATVEPGSMRAVFSTAPTPVVTPQPMIAAWANGIWSSIFTRAFSWTSILSAYAERFANWLTGWLFHVSFGGPSFLRTGRVWQMGVLQVMQQSHGPHETGRRPVC